MKKIIYLFFIATAIGFAGCNKDTPAEEQREEAVQEKVDSAASAVTEEIKTDIQEAKDSVAPVMENKVEVKKK